MGRGIQKSKFYTCAPLRNDLSWGVIVSDLQPTILMNEEARLDLYNLWIQEGVIVFQGVDSIENQLELSRIFGPLRSHPTREAVAEGYRELMDVNYNPENGWLMEVDGELLGTWLPWHSDLIYVDKINHGGILRPIKLPSALGATGFIDKIDSYERLPDRLKVRIKDLNVIYKYDMDISRIKFGKNHKARVVRHSKATASIQSRLQDFPTVIHPMVYAQPESGRLVLNVSSWFAMGIYELPGPDGDALLEEVVQHAVDERFAYYHRWKLGDMVLWDNWRMLHAAQGAPANEVRFLQRTTIGGDYGLGRVEPGVGHAKDAADYLQV